MAKYAQKEDEEQRRLEEMGYGKPNAAKENGGLEKNSLPPELSAIFDRLKNSAKKE